jgi:hypothetical protein
LEPAASPLTEIHDEKARLLDFSNGLSHLFRFHFAPFPTAMSTDPLSIDTESLKARVGELRRYL